MSDWNEIQRLAADFQRIQLTASAHKLSERNCIELVSKLISMNQLSIIYTIDGKEYITPQHLEREIRDELFVRRGRVNLTDLQQVTNVDLSYIDNKVKELLRNDRSLYIIQGELLDIDYLNRLAEEINDILQESGYISVSELGKTFNLPTDFLQTMVIVDMFISTHKNIEKRIGIYIHGQINPLERGTIYTEAYITRHTAAIRGVFSAITRPTPLSSLIARYQFPQSLLDNILPKLLEDKRLIGSIQGHQSKAVYIPQIYSRTQMNWVLSFFRQNDYIEYDSLTRLDIGDPKGYLRKTLDKNVMFLETCAAGQSILQQAQASLEDIVTTSSWIDIMTVLPSPFSIADASTLLQKYCLKSTLLSNSVQIFCDRIAVSNGFMQGCLKLFDSHMKAKAATDASKVADTFASTSSANSNQASGEHVESSTVGGKKKKGEDYSSSKRKSKGKDRSGTENMESSKSRGRQSKQELEFMTIPEIADVLRKEHPTCDDDFLLEIASRLFSPLRKSYQEAVKAIFLSSSSSIASEKRKKHADAEEKINGLWSNARLFARGIRFFTGDAQTTFQKHLLRTICTDITNIVFSLLIDEYIMVQSDPNSMNSETRAAALDKFPNKIKKQISALEGALNNKTVDQFFDTLDIVLGPTICQVMLKKLDKKKERQVIFNHRQNLIEQIKQESQPAMCLHLCAVLLFQKYTQCLIHAPGRCVPHIIAVLKGYLSNEQYELLYDYQQLVIRALQHTSESQPLDCEQQQSSEDVDNNPSSSVESQLLDKLTMIKELAIEGKKQS